MRLQKPMNDFTNRESTTAAARSGDQAHPISFATHALEHPSPVVTGLHQAVTIERFYLHEY